MTATQTKNLVISIGVDTGGTFTDLVLQMDNQIYTHKLLSTPDNPAQAVLQGIKEIISQASDLGHIQYQLNITHGSTVATNILLERNGAEMALLTTQNFEDLIEIGRQNRAELYNFDVDQPEPLVPSPRRYGVVERMLHTGQPQTEIDYDQLGQLINQLPEVEAVAVCFLFSYVNPAHEQITVDMLQQKFGQTSISISASHQILPEYREFERFSTTIANAYVQPKMQKYLHFLDAKLTEQFGPPRTIGQPKLQIMQSNGGSILVKTASQIPIRTALSGPAGGVIGASAFSQIAGYDRVITFDMGGTSTDVSLCDQKISLTTESKISGVPIQIPMIDIHTVGAGGGSIAQVDVGGALKVGPESAGADPGPACYGRGNFPTVTDANMFLGRIEPNHFLGGKMELYSAHSTRVINTLAQQIGQPQTDTAEGILQIANATMSRAIRRVSVERGYDPNDFALFSYGGAGGLHACFLAESLSIPTVIVPPHGGLMSAMGMLLADTVKDYSQTVLWSMDQDIFQRLSNRFSQLKLQADQEMQLEGISSDLIQYQLSLDLRYVGQSYELNVPFETEFDTLFHQLHKQRFGHSRPDFQIEIVHLRLRAVGLNEQTDIGKNPKMLEQDSQATGQPFTQKSVAFGQPLITNFYYRRDLLKNEIILSPAIVFELSTTTVIPPNFTGYVDSWKNLILSPV